MTPVDCLQLPYAKLIIAFPAISQTVDGDAKSNKSPTRGNLLSNAVTYLRLSPVSR